VRQRTLSIPAWPGAQRLPCFPRPAIAAKAGTGSRSPQHRLGFCLGSAARVSKANHYFAVRAGQARRPAFRFPRSRRQRDICSVEVTGSNYLLAGLDLGLVASIPSRSFAHSDMTCLQTGCSTSWPYRLHAPMVAVDFSQAEESTKPACWPRWR